jgi:hypothetical protein
MAWEQWSGDVAALPHILVNEPVLAGTAAAAVPPSTNTVCTSDLPAYAACAPTLAALSWQRRYFRVHTGNEIDTDAAAQYTQSHARAWKYVVDNNIPLAVVVCPGSAYSAGNCADTIRAAFVSSRAATLLPADNGIWVLGTDTRKACSPVCNGWYLFDAPFCLSAYILTQGAAAKLLQEARGVSHHLEWTLAALSALGSVRMFAHKDVSVPMSVNVAALLRSSQEPAQVKYARVGKAMHIAAAVLGLIALLMVVLVAVAVVRRKGNIKSAHAAPCDSVSHPPAVAEHRQPERGRPARVAAN